MTETNLAHKAYWAQQLDGELPRTSLTDTSRLSRQKEPVTTTFYLSAPLSAKLSAMTAGDEHALFTFLLASLYVLLYRYTGAEDLLVGVPVPAYPISDRRCQFLPVRTKIAGGMRSAAMVGVVADALQGAYEHEQVWLPESAADKSLTGTADVSAMFEVVACLEGLHVANDLGSLPAHTWFVFTSDHEQVGWQITSACFDEVFIHALGDHLRQAVDGLLRGPEISVRDIEILSAQEKQMILRNFNDNASMFPVSRTLSQLFAEQVDAYPDSIAVNAGGRSITYMQLRGLVAEIANSMKDHVIPGSFVAILEERGISFIASVLAIWELGAAYVPLDPANPRVRIESMLANSQPAVLLGHSHLLDGLFSYLTESETTRIVRIDEEVRPFVEFPRLAAGLPLGTPNDMAYLIYTSGSTGVPKGAVIRQSGAINHIYAERQALKLDHTCCFLQTAPCSSDIMVWQFLAPLLIGGRVAVASTESASDPARLLDQMQADAVTLAELVPVVLRALVEVARSRPLAQRALPALRHMMVTGEAVSATLVNEWLALYPLIPIVNCYGPTEASDDITQAEFNEFITEVERPVSIGKPLANIDIFLLDQDFQPVPIAVAGQLCVGGIAVGIGYWKDPEQTATAFVPNPIPDCKGITLYKTGDLARWTRDGQIEYLGRIDNQIKIRGVRIECEEIREVLLKHPGVRDGVIDARLVGGDAAVVAYFIPRCPGAVSEVGLRAHFQQALPLSMVPAYLVELDHFPLTASGKVSHLNLPHPVNDTARKKAVKKGQRPVEEIVAAIWCKLLGRDHVHPGDDFFAIGGQSLMATMMVSHIRSVLHLEVPLRTVFELRTVSTLAAYIVSAQQHSLGRNVPPLDRQARPVHLPLSFAQSRLWFFEKLSPGTSLYNIPSAVRLSGIVDRAALQWAIDEMTRRHEILRTNFGEVAGTPVQIIGAPGATLLAYVDLRRLSSEMRLTELKRHVDLEVKWIFDLAEHALLRTTLIQLDSEDFVLVINTHHIIFDGWSTAILVRELCELYRRRMSGDLNLLPKLPIQYADFALWQRSWLTGDVMEAQMVYWRKQLRLPLPQLQLKTDYPRTEQRAYAGGVESLMLTGIMPAVRTFGRTMAVTPFMTILAAFQILLHRYCGQDDIILGADVANRNRLETEGLIGFFINMMVLRVDLSGDPTVAELMAQVREVCLDAYAHQDVPFDRIVAELQPERNSATNPLFQVAIVLQNTPAEEPEVDGFSIQSFELPRPWSRFDALLELEEKSDTLTAQMEYSTNLFRPETIRLMLRHYSNALSDMMRDSNRRISSLSLMAKDDVDLMVPTSIAMQMSKQDLEAILLQAVC